MEGSNVGDPPAYVKHRSFLADRVLIVGPETRNLAAVVALDEHALTFVALAKGRGVSFQRSGTLGHQELSVSPREFTRAFAAAGVPVDPGHAEALVTSSGRWVDPVLRFLGADGVDSLDVSGYEKASIIHDLNAEIPADLEGRFTMLLDVGTLEHVFDFPTAIRNCMRMVEVGGHLILVLPTNNEAGHGFYQFSPELFFRVLAPEYGFTVEEMLIRELGSRRARWFRVADPGTRAARAQFVSRSVTYLFVLARRTLVRSGATNRPRSRLRAATSAERLRLCMARGLVEAAEESLTHARPSRGRPRARRSPPPAESHRPDLQAGTLGGARAPASQEPLWRALRPRPISAADDTLHPL